MRTIKREIVGAFIFSSDEKILLGYAGVYAGKLCVPGGGIERRESKLDALYREIKTETGLDLMKVEVEKIKGRNTGNSPKILRDTKEEVNVEMNFHDYIARLPMQASDIELVCEDDFIDGNWYETSSLTLDQLAQGTGFRLHQLGLVTE